MSNLINNIDDLIKFSAKYSVPKGIIESREKGRLDFISKFPLNSIQDFKVDDYCIGTSENSFCYWLEFKEILFGIGGGNASKFGIYKSKDGNYYEGYGPKKTMLQSSHLEEKFLAIKKAIIQGLDFVSNNEIEKIASIQTPIWNMVLLKIFCLYYPEKFLTIGDPDVIIECAKNINITGVELKNENSILLNNLCRKKLNETTEFSDWNYEMIGSFIWQTFKETAKRDYYLIGSKYGVNADKDVFPEMINRSVVSTEFASKIDLTDLYNENHSVIKEFLLSHNEESNSINAIKHFLSLRPGDLIAVKADGSPKGTEGYLSIVGIAEVIEKNAKVYEYDPNGLGHIINVKFINAPIFKELPLGGYGRTIHKLSNDEHINLIFKSNNDMGYYEELHKFLQQAKTNELKTSNYLKKYLGLEVKVSFGQGNQSRIPWIAFLNEIDTVQEGIYPVYLFYKDRDLLILAYGISETRTTKRNWNVINESTIEQYFSENGLGKPARYGGSYIYKIYKVNDELEKEKLDNDLNELLEIYKVSSGHTETGDEELFNYKSFHSKTQEAGFQFTEKIVSRFVASLCTKPFVICSGLSGSGKTKLAQSFVTWICKSDDQYKIVPVGADWTNREPLLGFPNGLDPDKYVFPDSGVLQLIINAGKTENENKPFFLILDEMNLSHVERYFADFLSIMESQDNIKLYSGNDRLGPDDKIIDKEISWPKNLFIIGTVNIDETTYMFSPKVLDRANVIEFRISEFEMANYLVEPRNPDMSIFINHLNKQGDGATMSNDFLKRTKEHLISDIPAQNILILFFNELRKCGAEFGYRSASEINRLISVLASFTKEGMKWDGMNITTDDFIDIAIMQKLLPKLHGSRNKLTKILPVLGALCLTDKEKIKEKYFENIDTIKFLEDRNIKYKLSFEKICRLYKNAIENGYASYAEA